VAIDPRVLASVMQRMQPSSQPVAPQIGAAPPPDDGVPPGPSSGGVPQGAMQGMAPQGAPQTPVTVQGTVMMGPAQPPRMMAPGGPTMDNSTVGGPPPMGGPLGAGSRPLPPTMPMRR